MLTAAMIAALCSCGEDDAKSKASGAVSGIINNAGQSVMDAGKKASDGVEDINKTELKVDPRVESGSSEDDGAEVDPDSDSYLSVGVEGSFDASTIDEVTGIIEGLMQKYPDGDVTVQQILDEIGNDDLEDVISDILTDPMGVPEDEKPSVVVHIDELLTKLQEIANEMIEGPMDKMAR